MCVRQDMVCLARFESRVLLRRTRAIAQSPCDYDDEWDYDC
jgi:hypothetical protein